MSSMVISWIVFGCVFGGALLGMFLRATLPEQHQDAGSRDVLKMLGGLLGMLAALVMGLLIGTGAASYITRRNQLAQMAVNIVLLDRGLGRYGPEAREARELLRRAVAFELQRTWPEDGSATSSNFDPTAFGPEILYDKIRELKPRDDVQRAMKPRLLTIVVNLGQMRWLLFKQPGSAIPVPFLVVLSFWLSLIFTSFGFFAPLNTTMVIALLMGALSVAAGIFLILELERPFGGLVQVSAAPLRTALVQLGH